MTIVLLLYSTPVLFRSLLPCRGEGGAIRDAPRGSRSAAPGVYRSVTRKGPLNRPPGYTPVVQGVASCRGPLISLA